MERRKRGRPVEKPMPERIPDTPDNVATILVNTPPKPKNKWRYMKENVA